MIFELIVVIVLLVLFVNIVCAIATDFLKENFPERYLLAERHKYRKLILMEMRKEKRNLKKYRRYQRRLDEIEDELNMYNGR